jgi:hypothetical protein
MMTRSPSSLDSICREAHAVVDVRDVDAPVLEYVCGLQKVFADRTRSFVTEFAMPYTLRWSFDFTMFRCISFFMIADIWPE